MSPTQPARWGIWECSATVGETLSAAAAGAACSPVDAVGLYLSCLAAQAYRRQLCLQQPQQKSLQTSESFVPNCKGYMVYTVTELWLS